MKHGKHIVRVLAFVIILVSMTAPAVPAQQALVICNKGVPQDTLSANDIQQIFLGRKTLWPDNRNIHFVVMKEGETHAEFLKDYVTKTPSQYQVFWKKMIFTGQAKAPVTVDTPEEVLTYVANTPGAIGYVPSGLGHDQVKVISVPAN